MILELKHYEPLVFRVNIYIFIMTELITLTMKTTCNG